MYTYTHHYYYYHYYYYYYYYYLWPASVGRVSATRASKRSKGPDFRGSDSVGLFPQLIFIHIHQLFGTQYTLFELDTVNIYWWWCINFCRVLLPSRRGIPRSIGKFPEIASQGISAGRILVVCIVLIT